MGRTLFCDDTCDECVRHGGAGIARLARPRRHLVVEDAAFNATCRRIFVEFSFVNTDG